MASNRNALAADAMVASDNPLSSRYVANLAPVGPANYYNPFPTALDFVPVYEGVPGAEPSQPVFSDKEAALEGLWLRRANAQAMWHTAVNGQYPSESRMRHFQAFQEADNAWLRGQVDPAINPQAAREDRWDAITLGQARTDADVMSRAIQNRQQRQR